MAPATDDPDTLALLDRLLNDHTDAEVAAKLNADGHRSGDGNPFTGRIVLDLRRSHGFPSHHERLHAHGLLTISELADRLGVHPTTINAWRRAGLTPSHKANDRNEPTLTTRPPPATRGSSNTSGRRLDQRENPSNHAPGGAL